MRHFHSTVSDSCSFGASEDQCVRFIGFFVKPLQKVGALRNSYALVFVHLFVRLFVCRQRVLIGHWPA